MYVCIYIYIYIYTKILGLLTVVDERGGLVDLRLALLLTAP